jgi:hypothetical protein
MLILSVAGDVTRPRYCSVEHMFDSDVAKGLPMDLIDLINRGSATASELDDAVHLQKAAEEFLGAYAMFDGYDVVAASSIAERVLGAAMMIRPGLSGSGKGRTVIFDVTVASGTQMARAAQRLRHAGNSDELVGIALHTLACCESTNAQIEDLVQLVIAHPPERDFALAEGCEGSHGRVGLAL